MFSKMKRSNRGVKPQVKEVLKEHSQFKDSDIELELVATMKAKPYYKTSPDMEFTFEIDSREEHA